MTRKFAPPRPLPPAGAAVCSLFAACLVYAICGVPPVGAQTPAGGGLPVPAVAPAAAGAGGVPGASASPSGPLGPTGGRVGAGEVQIVGGNIASARERALTEALKQAVNQAISSMAPDPHQSQPKTVVQVLGRARSYVRRYRTLDEGERGRGLYGVRVEAEIDDGSLLRAFDKPAGGAAPAAGPSSTSASMPSYLLVGAGAPEAVDAAARAFTGAGARVQRASATEAAEPSKAIEAAARAGVATVAFVSGSATAEGKVRGPGVEAVTCVLGVRVLTSGTGQPVADESETVRSFGERVELARADCFQRAAAAAVPRVVPAAAARVTPDVRTIVLEVDVVQPAAIPALVKQVRALGSVSAVEVRRITATRAELWVRSRLSAAAFAAALGRDTGAPLLFGPAEMTGDLVRVQGRMREVATPAPVPASAAAVPTSASPPPPSDPATAAPPRALP